MKLYSYWQSSSSWRVRIVLAIKGVAYEYAPVDLSPERRAQASEDYAAINPMHQIPTLEWSEDASTLRLTQTVAIAEYLEARFPEPRLLPEDPLQRAWVLEAVEIVNAGIQPLQNSTVLATLRRITGESEVRAWTLKAMTKGLGALEALARVRGGRFSVGDTPTLADVFLVPQLFKARHFEVALDAYPKLLEIEARAASLDAFARAHPDRQPDARVVAPAPSSQTSNE